MLYRITIMNHKTTNSRWSCPSNITESKLPHASIQRICGNSEIHRTMGSEMKIEAYIPVGAPRTPERERYSLSYDGIDEMRSGRGGETNAR